LENQGPVQNLPPITTSSTNDGVFNTGVSIKREDTSAYPPVPSNFYQKPQADLVHDFRIKYEGNELPKRRKKMCRKIYSTFMEEFKLEKSYAKVATLNTEYRIHCLINYEDDKYVDIIKKLFKFIKGVPSVGGVNGIEVEIRKILKLSIGEFERYLKGNNI
jgi:hypothetical protein